MDHNRKILKKARLLVIKLGSGILSQKDGGLDIHQIRHLAEQVSQLRKKKYKILIVSSGAISAGMGRLKLHKRPTKISDLQACAAIGQNLLTARYEHAFTQQNLTVAQILLTHEDLRHPTRRRNAKQTMLNLLKKGVIPIINENDAVSFTEIPTFRDNDQLAAMVHELIPAQACIILSNVEGFLIRNSSVLSCIPKITSSIEQQAGISNSQRSVGGMRSKLTAARRVLSTGCPLVIANGRIPSILPRLIQGEPLGTIFLP